MTDAPPRSYDVDHDVKLLDEYRIGRLFDVYLDGRPLTRVIRFNADERWVERFLTDEEGKVVLDRVAREAKRETLHGHVETRWREPVGA